MTNVLLGRNSEKPLEKGYEWVDVTSFLSSTCSQLNSGEMLHQKSFSLSKIMSTVEIMEPKMDTGMNYRKRTSRTPSQLFSTNELKLTDLTVKECLSIMDMCSRASATWFKGRTLTQTIFTCLYVPYIEKISNKVLQTFMKLWMKSMEHVYTIMEFGRSKDVKGSEEFSSKTHGNQICWDFNVKEMLKNAEVLIAEMNSRVLSEKVEKKKSNSKIPTEIDFCKALMTRLKFQKLFLEVEILYAELLEAKKKVENFSGRESEKDLKEVGIYDEVDFKKCRSIQEKCKEILKYIKLMKREHRKLKIPDENVLGFDPGVTSLIHTFIPPKSITLHPYNDSNEVLERYFQSLCRIPEVILLAEKENPKLLRFFTIYSFFTTFSSKFKANVIARTKLWSLFSNPCGTKEHPKTPKSKESKNRPEMAEKEKMNGGNNDSVILEDEIRERMNKDEKEKEENNEDDKTKDGKEDSKEEERKEVICYKLFKNCSTSYFLMNKIDICTFFGIAPELYALFVHLDDENVVIIKQFCMCYALYLNYIVLNRSKQRRKLMKLLEDHLTKVLINASYIDMKNKNKRLLGIYVASTMVLSEKKFNIFSIRLLEFVYIVVRDVLNLGFELALYSFDEYSFVYAFLKHLEASYLQNIMAILSLHELNEKRYKKRQMEFKKGIFKKEESKKRKKKKKGGILFDPKNEKVDDILIHLKGDSKIQLTFKERKSKMFYLLNTAFHYYPIFLENIGYWKIKKEFAFGNEKTRFLSRFKFCREIPALKDFKFTNYFASRMTFVNETTKEISIKDPLNPVNILKKHLNMLEAITKLIHSARVMLEKGIINHSTIGVWLNLKKNEGIKEDLLSLLRILKSNEFSIKLIRKDVEAMNGDISKVDKVAVFDFAKGLYPIVKIVKKKTVSVVTK